MEDNYTSKEFMTYIYDPKFELAAPLHPKKGKEKKKKPFSLWTFGKDKVEK